MIKSEAELRQNFKDLIITLAEKGICNDKIKRSQIYKELEGLYKYGFRHYYSDIFEAFVELEDRGETHDINSLLVNINILRGEYIPSNNNDSTIDMSNIMKKLYDHVNLEIARLDYTYTKLMKISEKTGKLYRENKKGLENMKRDLVKARKKVSNLQKDHITILSIFSGIVLSFIGGLVFSSSVLENIDKVSVYRLTLTSLIIGLVLVNILFGMFYFICAITNKLEAKAALKPFKIANVLFIGGIILLIILWLVGFVEWRDSLRQP